MSEKHTDGEIRIADAHNDDVVRFVAFEVIVPEVADEFYHFKV
jgi:hypothetical protein